MAQQMMQLIDAAGALGRQQVSGWTDAGGPLVRWQEVAHQTGKRTGRNARVVVEVPLGGIDSHPIGPRTEILHINVLENEFVLFDGAAHQLECAPDMPPPSGPNRSCPSAWPSPASVLGPTLNDSTHRQHSLHPMPTCLSGLGCGKDA